MLRQHDALFKVPVDLALLGHLNSGDSGFSQIGKFLTAYSRSDADAVALARDLHAVTRGFAAPKIPFDARCRQNSLVYYRYGAYGAAGRNGEPTYVLDARGKWHRDRRAPRTAVPNGWKIHFMERPVLFGERQLVRSDLITSSAELSRSAEREVSLRRSILPLIRLD